MTRGFRLTARAAADLREILEHVASDDLTAAQRLADAFEKAFDLLQEMPRIGSERVELAPRPVRIWRVRRYAVIYRSSTQPIEIVRIFHGARDLRALFDPTTELKEKGRPEGRPLSISWNVAYGVSSTSTT